MMRQQRCEIRWHGEKKRGAIALDVRVDRCRNGARGRKNGSGSTAKRKVTGIAESVREKQSRDAEAAVAFLHLQNAFGVELATHHHVVMQMHAAFGGARAPGGVQPERRLVLASERGLELWRSRSDQVLQRMVRMRSLTLQCW